MRRPLVIYDFATFWISLYMRKILFSFLSVCHVWQLLFLTSLPTGALIFPEKFLTGTDSESFYIYEETFPHIWLNVRGPILLFAIYEENIFNYFSKVDFLGKLYANLFANTVYQPEIPTQSSSVILSKTQFQVRIRNKNKRLKVPFSNL